MSTAFNPDDPEELLQHAAASARQLIPAAEARLKELIEAVRFQEAQLARLHQLASLGGDDQMPHVLVKTMNVLRNSALYQAEEERNRDTTAIRDIDLTLLNAKEPMKVADIREIIKTVMGHSWAESTIYNHLGRGKSDGKYLNENNRWSLTDKGRENVL